MFYLVGGRWVVGEPANGLRVGGRWVDSNMVGGSVVGGSVVEDLSVGQWLVVDDRWYGGGPVGGLMVL